PGAEPGRARPRRAGREPAAGAGRTHRALARRLACAAAAAGPFARAAGACARLPRRSRLLVAAVAARRARGPALRRPSRRARAAGMEHRLAARFAAAAAARARAGRTDRGLRRAAGRRGDRVRGRRRRIRAMSAGKDTFAPRLLRWFRRAGGHGLPWEHPRTPYRVWRSEIMLQQTQVRVVLPCFERFAAALPDVAALAAAPLDEGLALWSGLGYYARARNLHAAAALCVERHDGVLPRDFDALLALPGIGRSTAGAILSQAWGERIAILD